MLLRDYLEPIVGRTVDDMERLLWLLFSERCAPGYKIERSNDHGTAFQFAPARVASER
jgi:hypothetical protein